MLDAAGRCFDTLYEMSTSKLGDGMTACVFVVKDRTTGALRACKLAERRAQRHNWSRLCQLMRHESTLLQEIGYHPNVVRWEGSFASCNRLAIVMELVVGGDCQQLLQRHGALAEETVHAMICQLFAALSRLHGLGILHRDVKLENLLCDTSTRPPRVKLCDFGHAVTQRDLMADRQFYGTPGYAAPEVVQGPVWTAKADVWAMGIVMYAMLANSLPFDCEDGWRRPADLSSRAWWRVSLEAKLLLQALLEPQLDARGSLQTFEQSAWRALSPDQRRDEPPAPMRQAFSYSEMSAMQVQQSEARRKAMTSGRAGPLPHAASWTELQLATGTASDAGDAGAGDAGGAGGELWPGPAAAAPADAASAAGAADAPLASLCDENGDDQVMETPATSDVLLLSSNSVQHVVGDDCADVC